jgi:hypothetical protein
MEFFVECIVPFILESSRYLSSSPFGKDLSGVNSLIELANSIPLPPHVFLNQKWFIQPLDSKFSLLSQVSLDALYSSFSIIEREKFYIIFSKEKEKQSQLAKSRSEFETSIREIEEACVYLEVARLNLLIISNNSIQQNIKENWLKFLHQVQCGKTIWTISCLHHFKFSEQEDNIRRKIVLKANLNFTNHSNASYDSSLNPHSNKKYVEPFVTTTLITPQEFDQKEEILYVLESVKWVNPSLVNFGRVEISQQFIYFYSSTEISKWRLDEILEIHSRRYLLRPIAIELFFSNRTTAFFAFSSTLLRDEISNQILKLKPLRLEKAFTGSLSPPPLVLKRSKLTEQWQKHEISNFEYLMRLNTIAGRTYNDITQYFVFPWILSEYESENIDLTNVKNFRDLTKPIGALNEQRAREVQERFNAFAEIDMMDMPPFHHGSHYSSAGVVLHYLIRIEPFSTLAIELQGGRFDVPDRLFHSIKDCFKSCYSSLSDCRELIPEFFYLSEMFMNKDELNLGTRQDGCVVDNVILPLWAKDDAELFVRLNREALESDYVSDNLHHWIDLIFGYKQRGKVCLC